MDTSVIAVDVGLGFPFWVASRRRFKPDDLFFAAGNTERELLAKHVKLFNPLLSFFHSCRQAQFLISILIDDFLCTPSLLHVFVTSVGGG
jgi:hypothetical protein